MVIRNSLCTGSDVYFSYLVLYAYASQAGGETGDFYREFIDCTLAADNCTQVLACGYIDANSSCDLDEFTNHCQGQTAVNCVMMEEGPPLVSRIPCPGDFPSNPLCMVDSEGEAVCGSIDSDQCTSGHQEWCVGDMLVECSNGIPTRFNCGDLGLTCKETDHGDEIEAECVGDTQCQDDFCDGDRYVECSHGFSAMSIDCKWLDPKFECLMKEDDGEMEAQCSMPAGMEECESGDAKCAGSVARVCVIGKWFDFDCATFQKGTCEEVPEDKGYSWDFFYFGDGIRCVPAT